MALKSIPSWNVPALALAACLAACAHKPPGLAASDTPAAWSRAAAQPASEQAQAPAFDPYWWDGFRSAELAKLLAEAQANGFDTRQAALRVIEAEAQATSAGSNLWPGVDLGASARRSGDFSPAPRASSLSASLGLGYEADLWGRLRANNRAALASLAATRFDRDTVAIDLSAGVANGYFQVLNLRDRLRTARGDLDIAEQVLKIVAARANAGSVPPLDLAQQQATVARQRAAIAPLEQQEKAARQSLALLLGRQPIGFDVAATTLADIEVPAVAADLPSALLARRPDVAAAEARLAASSANLDAARAQYLPSLSLTGSAGAASNALKSLVDPVNAAWSIGASLGQTIFDAGTRQANIKAASAREEEALLSYREAALTAFSEADLALSNVSSLASQRADRETEIATAREAYRIAQIRYREGADNLQALLQAQSALFSAEDSLSQIKLQQAQGAVTLYRALGGGWERAQLATAQ